VNHDHIDPIPLSQVPLGSKFLADFGKDESEARTFRENNRTDSILVIDTNGTFSVWIYRKPFWPIE
jgi:hypothetical protein